MTPDTPATPSQEFFDKRQSAAVLKHAILRCYLPPWAGKVGSTSLDHRVAIGDCYAGAGRYADGSPGSPAIIAGLAEQPSLRSRTVEAYFIEQDSATFLQLLSVLEQDAGALTWRAWQGAADEHLDELLAQTEGVPLFLFLDPFGQDLSLERIMTALATRPSGAGSAPTEALIRIDTRAVWRTRGVLHGTKPNPSRDAQLHRLDLTAGGDWWRAEDDPSLKTGEYLDWFSGELLHRVCTRWGWAGWVVPVRRKTGLLPVYYLLFLTRHPDGMTVFNDALSLATGQWRRTIHELAFEDSLLGVTDVEESFKHQETDLANEWQARLKINVTTLLDEVPSFVVQQHLQRVFAGVLGLAREKHLRVALRELHDEGRTSSDSKGGLYGKRVIRA